MPYQQLLGLVMLAMVFVALFVVATVTLSWQEALGIFAVTAVLVTWLIVATSLLNG